MGPPLALLTGMNTTLFIDLQVVIVITMALLGLGCGQKNNNEGATGPSVASKVSFSHFQYSNLQSSAITAQSVVQAQAVNSDLSNFPHYGWAHMDGLKLWLTDVSLQGDNGYSQIFTHAGYGIELKGETTRLALPSTQKINAGRYTQFSFGVQNHYELKAWALVKNQTCYTTRPQIVCVAGQVDPSQFINYDYYAYNYLYVTTSKSADDGISHSGFSGEIPGGVQINEGQTADIQIVIDTYRIATFWDGQEGRPNVSPFTWSNNYGRSTDEFFPAGVPNFGVTYIPFFMAINDAGIPKGEVYALSNVQDSIQNFDPNTYDLQGIQYLTMLYDSSGKYLESRVINFGQPLNQFIGDFTKKEDGSYEFSNGEHKRDGGNFKDRRVKNFNRTEVGVIQTATLFNGPECGLYILDTEHPEWGNRVRECLNADANIFVKRAR